MKLLAEKYRSLQPKIDYLSDPLIIAQAWKKSHKYIRTHNWYADTLALDISALDLESNSTRWGKRVLQPGFKPHQLELVTAAKSEPWALSETDGWNPTTDSTKRCEKPPIRPLAHISVRDQTLATAVMLCVANAVENEQGDCSKNDFFIARANEIYSYGNRLICDWSSGTEGWFQWGNADTYRKFFTDYQNFLKRPAELARNTADSTIDRNSIYVISLDIERFYDRVDRNVLIRRLKEISLNHYRETPCDEFWRATERILNWQWDENALLAEQQLKISLGNGLPQGLVASGFFANAFLIQFDREIGKQLSKATTDLPNIELIDYCRYVDDIRLVVKLQDGKKDIPSITQTIGQWVEDQLKRFGGQQLSLNKAKIKVASVADLDNSGSVSSRMTLLQQDLSGPADRDVLENASAALEGLLSLQPDSSIELQRLKKDNDLASLIQFDQDIRPDTLKRFAANRLEAVIRAKRKIRYTSDTELKTEGESTNDESELLAKKLIRAWMQDPSLGLVLRKALEIYPSEKIAKPVFDAIYRRSSLGGRESDKATIAIMDYLLADLFRCCIDFNGYFQRVEYPQTADPTALLKIGKNYAKRVTSASSSPKFLERQALLLLAVLDKPIQVEDPELTVQHSLLAILKGACPKFHRQRLALFEIAAQISDTPSKYSRLVLDFMRNEPDEEKLDALATLAKRGGPFWEEIWRDLKKDNDYVYLQNNLLWAVPVTTRARIAKASKQKLQNVIYSSRNCFEHEAALIKLGIGLAELASSNADCTRLAPRDILIKVTQKSRWDELWHPSVETIKCSLNEGPSAPRDPRFELPPWLDSSATDARSIYWIGAILRASAVGTDDFTGNRWRSSSIKGYKGLRTGWYKRRMGMMHSAEALVGKFATISEWMTELLMTCLQWPGFEATHIQNEDIAKISSMESFVATLQARLKLLNDLHCAASGIPALVTKVKNHDRTRADRFRLVSVQQLLPKTKDLQANPTLSSPKERARHRDHISRICFLTYKTLLAQLKADIDDSPVGADLIVFPEVAIHPDDQDIIKRLADKTKAIVLAGLVFQDLDGKLVNIARWFIPDYQASGRRWIIRDQGKEHMTRVEKSIGISSYRPCQHIIEIVRSKDLSIRLSGAICYDATDLKLASDLKGKTDLFVVCAHNKDVGTFDTMVSALNYHMYEHVALVNKGEYGGSTVQAPYRESFHRLISHAHGLNQISINIADLQLKDFRSGSSPSKKPKEPPAGH